MKTAAISFVLAIAVLGAVGVTTTVMSSAITTYAKGPPGQANPNAVAGGAVGNEEYQTNCQKSQPPQECAQDPLHGSGPFTSSLAHKVNKLK
ncbi:MAG TPA: hypothetical protein VE593_03335 [Nitrososphaeraceae archaeon]|nr:hypothetical protein [Nitrososphaeraceae archaeon]